MNPADYQRIAITSAEAASLTLGSWSGIAKEFEIKGYCHECDKVDAVGLVVDFFLDMGTRSVTAEVKYKCCGTESVISYGVLDEKLLVNTLVMARK